MTTVGKSLTRDGDSVRGRFVGRERQLVVASEQLLNARAGRPAPLLITGESGAGKSMFLGRVVEEAEATGFRVFRLDGESPTTAGPHRALAGAVGQWAQDRPGAAVSA